MLKFELFPDGDVHVSLGWNGGNVLRRRRCRHLRLRLCRRCRDLVGTEALFNGLVLVFDAARAWNEQNSIVLHRILASPLSSSTCVGEWSNGCDVRKGEGTGLFERQ